MHTQLLLSTTTAECEPKQSNIARSGVCMYVFHTGSIQTEKVLFWSKCMNGSCQMSHVMK